jgi:small subunit ribosomal protein S9
MAASSAFHGVGRRKSSVARVWLQPGSGKIDVNGKNYLEYFPTEAHKFAVRIPLEVTNKIGTVDINVLVQGGGNTGQADATKLGIARAIVLQNPLLRPILKGQKLLTVDARVVERKKPGRKGARRRFQFVKR